MKVPPTIQTVLGLTEFKQDVSKPSTEDKEHWYSVSWTGIIAEFISTVLLVLFGCMACLVPAHMYAAFGFGFVVMMNIQIFGHISGALMNPAIVILYIIWGYTSIFLGVIYIIVQCIAAVVGYGILQALSMTDVVSEGVCTTIPLTGQNVLQTMFIEFFLTAALAFIVCSVSDPVHAAKQDSTPIKLGLTIVGLSLVGGPATGASMNPARTLGPAVWTGVWTHHWAYWVGPMAGSLCATILYRLTFLKKSIQKQRGQSIK